MAETTVTDHRTVEFRPGWYEDLLDSLRSLGYRIGPVTTDPDAGDVLLRHDVDLSVESALEMARIEADRGIRSTYFFLVTSPLYNVLNAEVRDRIAEIAALDHDVALHFSTHQYPVGPDDEAAVVERVREEQSVLGTVVDDPAEPVSFHVPPDWVLDRGFEAFPSTYAPELFSAIGYVADSGQRWRDEPPLADQRPETMQLTVHPGLWTDEDLSFEDCVERGIAESCRRTIREANEEFLGEVGE